MKNAIGTTQVDTRTWRTPEFLLVIVMLAVLTILVSLVLWAPLPGESKDPQKQILDAKDLLDYRKSILAMIITAFGAWVGAGAAYYFGRENLRQASDSLLAMKAPSPGELLRKTPIREIPPRPIDWTLKETAELGEALGKFKSEPQRWYIPIIKSDGVLETVIHEEAVWRFMDKESEAGTAYADVQNKKISDVLAFVRGTKGLERVEGIFVAMNMDKSAGEANELMQRQEVYLSIITDEKGKPTHYFTTGDLRKLLLQMT